MKRLKIGVIGCGVMGGFHLKQYKNIPEAEIVGVSDIDPTRAPNDVTFYKDYHGLLELCDAVSITTPTSMHYEIGMQALDCGCSCLIEKPIALDHQQGGKLIKKARERKLTLAVGHIERFNPAFTGLLKHLRGGKPDVIDIRRLSPFPERIADVSVVIDMMIHDIDLARKLAGSEVKRVNAMGKKVRTNRLDSAFAVIVFKNGVIANIEASRVHNEKVRSLVVSSGASLYEADLLNKSLKVNRDERTESIKTETLDQLNVELRDFINSIEKKRDPLVTGKDGLAALEIAEQIEKAAVAQCS